MPFRAGHDVIIVTSGAVGMGMTKTGFSKKPELVAAKQALAAIGQIHLMRTYTDMMNSLGMVGAQVSQYVILFDRERKM